jgi:hypothetical protein
MFQAVNDQMVIAQLIFVFTCVIGDTLYPIALVQPYFSPPGQRSRKDEELNFYRVRAKPPTSCEFISVHSIIRGVLLAKDYDTANDSLVIDIIDTDMFLRMKMLSLSTT